MRKLLAIAWREVYTRITDRNLMLLMLAAPVGISTLVGLAFGGLTGGSSPVQHIPVIVVNQDQGREGARFGDELAGLITGNPVDSVASSALQDCPVAPASVDDGDIGLDDLLDGVEFDALLAGELFAQSEIDAPEAKAGSAQFLTDTGRAAVDRGLYTAVVIIPPEFSQALLEVGQSEPAMVQVEVYANQGRVIAAGIVRSVVDSIVSQMASGSIAIGTSIDYLLEQDPAAMAALADADFGAAFGCAFMPTADMIGLSRQAVSANDDNSQVMGLLVAVGSAQGMFFALFSGQYGILGLYEDRKNWTLQRLISTPTPRWAIFGGKLVGVISMVILQLALLGFALTLVGSLMSGRLALIWGQDLGLVLLLLLAVATAVGGLSMLVAGFMRSIEQANIFVTVLNMGLAVLGGAFGFSMPDAVGRLSLIHWGRQAFELVAAGQTDIGLHLAVLMLQGVVFFLIGLFMFSRRFEV